MQDPRNERQLFEFRRARRLSSLLEVDPAILCDVEYKDLLTCAAQKLVVHSPCYAPMAAMKQGPHLEHSLQLRRLSK